MSFAASAAGLKEILQYTLTSAPEILEANADISASQNRTGQAAAGHWPVVSVGGSKIIEQHHREPSDYYKTGFTPNVKAELNLYAFGAIEKNIDRSRKEEEYYRHRYTSVREDLAYTVSRLYLQSLNMKEAVHIMKKSLTRHKTILNNLHIIATNDSGRESEYVQAEARIIMIEQYINRYQKQLTANLNTLSKYTKSKVSERDLNNPFKNLTDEQLFKYTVKDKTHIPAYQAQQAELDGKRLAIEADKRSELPKLNLVGSASRDNRYVGVEVSWDLLNRGKTYNIREKTDAVLAAGQRLERISRDIENLAQVAKLNLTQSRAQLKTLKAQIAASAKVVDYYRLQFDIARRSLLDVLNAERELADVELAFANTEYELHAAILDYLYSQGKIAVWSGITAAPQFNIK